MILLFFGIKFLSDISLILDKPVNMIWEDINLGLFSIGYDKFFLSNVDPFIGLLLIGLIYLFDLSKVIFVILIKEKKWLKITLICFNVACLVFNIVFLFTFQLSFSFSVLSAIIIVLFSNFASKLFEERIIKKFQTAKNTTNVE
jgi:hypothetical protein